jgi:hypothetical protein
MRKMLYVLSLLVVASMVLTACGAPAATPQTIVQTVVVAGTPQVQVVEVTPTPAPVVKPAILRVNLGRPAEIVLCQRNCHP